MPEPNPLIINGVIPKWENPQFTPGLHCTQCRFNALPKPGFSDFPYCCTNCIESLRAWKKRSDSAKRGALKRKQRKLQFTK